MAVNKDPNAKYLGQSCHSCAHGTYVNTKDFNEWWVKCDNCGYLFFAYDPMPHQLRFHNDPSKFKMYAGG